MPIENTTSIQPQVIICQEGATAGSFKNGDLVYTNSSGQVILSTTNAILGIARADASGTQGTELAVELVNEFDVYALPYEGTTVTDMAVVGQPNDLVHTAGAQVVATTQGSAKEVFIVGIDGRQAEGAAGGKLLIRFNNPANLAR
jgi:hypothetical protein